VLLLILVMPAGLLLMICMLERYERLIDRPSRAKSAVDAEVSAETPELATDLAPELA
jgi:hypothetical protein